MGRQSMTLLKQLPAESRFSYLSPAGGPAGGAQKISVVVVDLGDRISVHAIAPARWD
jgi:hypothetical protein